MDKSSHGYKWLFETTASITVFKSNLISNFKIHSKAPKFMQGFYIAEETDNSITFKLGTALMTTFSARLDFSKSSPELIVIESSKLDSTNTENMNVFVRAVQNAFKSSDPQCVVMDGTGS